MTLVSTPRGTLFPDLLALPISFTSATIDAATEKVAMIGRLFIAGRPAGTKTLSTGTIQYRTQAVTFANGGTTVDIGIQGVSAVAGLIAQPDGTFTVKTTLTGGGGGITASAWNTATMNSGTTSLSHGDLIAVVWDMTARAGADSVLISTQNPWLNQGISFGVPTTNVFVSSAWQTTVTSGSARGPNVIIVFDDGTLGWIDYTVPCSVSNNTEFWQDSTNPDERGMIFQVPWDCKFDAVWAYGAPNNSSGGFTLKVYSDPLGTPSSIASVTVNPFQTSVAGGNQLIIEALASEVSLSKGTDYAVTMRSSATGGNNTFLYSATLGNEAHRAAINGTTTLKKASRQNDTGAFTAESPAVTMYPIGVRISSQHDTSSGGSGGFPVLGGPFT